MQLQLMHKLQMIQTKKSGAKFSAIVEVGETLKRLTKETGNEYLALNRGVNAVCLLDLESVSKHIEFNSTDMQVYPPNNGRLELLDAINAEYFQGNSKPKNFCVTNGGMNALDIVISSLDIYELVVSDYFWGAYRNICKVHSMPLATYSSIEKLQNMDLTNKAVIVCEPNNPIGNAHTDEELLEAMSALSDRGVAVLFDSPYRKLFSSVDKDLTFYQAVLKLENVIITESFSKSIGLSGQRLGFIHSTNEEFNKEVSIRLLYDSNGVSASSQLLVEKLFTTAEGKNAAADFKKTTVEAIEQNIEYLRSRHLLCEEFYQNTKPVGIFVVINKSYDELLSHRIGSVPLTFFMGKEPKPEDANKSRICVSVPHEKFVEFFDNIE